MPLLPNNKNLLHSALWAKNSSSHSPYRKYGSFASFAFRTKRHQWRKFFGVAARTRQKEPLGLSQAGVSRVVTLVIVVIWCGLLGLAALNRQNIIDWWLLRNYQAPVAVSTLATQDTLTSYARKVFYVNHPLVDDKVSFATTCPNNGGEQTIVLGCYHGNQAGIFLLSVNDPRLDGVEQVTAAHEMLHAVYDRLSSKDRTKVDAMLMDFYQHGLQDQRIKDTIAAYKKSEPHDVVNEMHSVFGTEVPTLPSQLETYYQRYFVNRAAVAGFATKYQSEFTNRKTAVSQADVELAQLKAQINASEADLPTKQAAITSEQSRLLGLKNSGNISGYNAGVPAYNRLIDSYNAEVHDLQSLVDQYNTLVGNRNAIALEQDQLVNELKTNVSTINR